MEKTRINLANPQELLELPGLHRAESDAIGTPRNGATFPQQVAHAVFNRHGQTVAAISTGER